MANTRTEHGRYTVWECSRCRATKRRPLGDAYDGRLVLRGHAPGFGEKQEKA